VELEEFVRAAEREFAAVPEEFRRGVAGPVVRKGRKAHPHLPEYFTLGECLPLSPMFTGDGPQQSTVFLYYGSFLACAKRDPAFDIGAEIRETVRHEILHHVEDRAGARDLLDEDAAEEQDERRREGLPFRPGYWRLGKPEGPGLWRLHHDLFLEVDLAPRDLARARREGLPVRHGDETLRLEPADLEALPAFVSFEGDREGEELVVVVRAR
jgi:hypothetical protein